MTFKIGLISYFYLRKLHNGPFFFLENQCPLDNEGLIGNVLSPIVDSCDDKETSGGVVMLEQHLHPLSSQGCMDTPLLSFPWKSQLSWQCVRGSAGE